MEMAAKEMRTYKMRRVDEMNDNAAAAYPLGMTFKEIRAFRKNKMRMSRQNKKIDDAAARPCLPEEMNIDAAAAWPMNIDAAAAPAPCLPEEMNIDVAVPASYLPEELVIENILTRLPLRSLAQYSCVSKLWCNLVSNDAKFAKTHLATNKNHRESNLVLSLLNVWLPRGGANFLSLDSDYKYRLYMHTRCPSRAELVGYCNGLACFTQISKYAYRQNRMVVVNPVRLETLSLPYYYPNDGGECEYLCHGFGFDSATDEYKVVIIFTSKDNEEFRSMVFTLGTNSWRKSVTSVAQINLPPGCSTFPPSRLATRAATFCRGNLFWRINANGAVEEDPIVHYNKKIGMLLSFDIHKEKIQFIRLPTACSLTAPRPTMMNVVVEHHLLEHKGYPCVAQSEKEMACHCGDGQTSVSCGCCCFTVQLYLLKDKEKQAWIKGETFSVQVRDLGSPPAPFCFYFDTPATAAASIPARMLSVSGQVLLYWFDGEYLKIYNLQTKHLEVVGSSSSCDKDSGLIFDRKMSPPKCFYDDTENYYLYIDCQLHDQAENILSLKTFIPAGGETSRHYDSAQFTESQKKNPPAGWVTTVRESPRYHAFF